MFIQSNKRILNGSKPNVSVTFLKRPEFDAFCTMSRSFWNKFPNYFRFAKPNFKNDPENSDKEKH